MINANEARELALAKGALKRILDNIESDIKAACEKGEFTCRILFPEEFKLDCVREKVLHVLLEEGYEYHGNTTPDGRDWLVIKWENKSINTYYWDN